MTSYRTIIKKLHGGGDGLRKRKRASSRKPRKQRTKRAKITKRKSSSSSSSKRKASRTKTIKRDILVIRIIRYPIMSGDAEFVNTEFDIFAHKPVQVAIIETNAFHYNPIATVDQNDLEFSIPADNETYIDLDIKLYVKGKINRRGRENS
jgi:hypothetical protein